MDIDKWLQIVKAIPREKLKTDEGLRDVIRQLAKKAGKNVSDKQLDQYVAKFRAMSRNESAASLMSKLSQRGIKQQELEKIKRRLQK
ncbi:hypothetical protein [Brevibacillus marinus]|uniref:hypothetical protein n=1 Tax=Brevibacillus marinus TaxID=2496837 RepID=UPI000F820BE8|nr:hypothetical protein [Brevibacillus marinus]